MSSRTAHTPSKRAPHNKMEPEEPDLTALEPKQSHFGNVLAILSVMAVLAFGLWAAFSTLTAADKPVTKTSATATPAKAGAHATAEATSAPTKPPAGPTDAPAAQATTTAPAGGKVHVVGSGDTLYGIARRYGTTVEAIMAANGFTDRSKILHVGDRLIIP